MLFKKYGSIPPGTTRTDPEWHRLKVTKGTLRQWLIFSDPEAADLLHYKVLYHGVSLMPFQQDDWIEGYLQPITIPDNIILDEAPYILDIKAWNEDDTFEHEYYIHASIIREEPAAPASPPPGVLEQFKKLFTRR